MKHDSVWIMMSVVWSWLEVNVMNNDYYVKGVLTYTHIHSMNEWMELMNENGGPRVDTLHEWDKVSSIILIIPKNYSELKGGL